MDAVFLDLAGSDLGDPEFAEEGQQMEPNAYAVTFNPAGASPALGDDLIFLQELVGSLLDGLFRS